MAGGPERAGIISAASTCALPRTPSRLAYYDWNIPAKSKLSVSIDSRLEAALRAAATRRQEQISEVVSHALAEYLEKEAKLADGMAAMAEYEAEYGPFTRQELEEARVRNDALLAGPATARKSA